MSDPSLYRYRVKWSQEDGEYVGLCDEFPSLSWLEPLESEALEGIKRLVVDTIAEMLEAGDTIPAPRSGDEKLPESV